MSVVIKGSSNINLDFTTGGRITGDFSNATLASRVYAQTNGTNLGTSFGVIPNGTGANAAYNALANSDPTNTSFGQFRAGTDTGDVRITSGVTGTGTFLPMTFFTGGGERVRIDTSGNVGIGTSSPGAKLDINNQDAANTFPLVLSNSIAGISIASAGLGFNAHGVRFAQIVGGQQTNGTFADGALQFFTRGAEVVAERARIDSSGNLLIGATSIGAPIRLFSRGSGTGSGTYSAFFENSAATLNFFVRDDGAINTGVAALSPYNLTTANAANLNVDSSGALARSVSSIKYKTDVQDATHGLAEVMSLRPVTYKGKNDGDKMFGGLIAEEVHAAGLTEFVQYASDESPDALHYGNMVSLAFKAIQEQQAMIEQLKADVAALKGTV